MLRIKEKGFNLFYFDELMNEQSEIAEHAVVNENDIYSFCYTSGTTGHPKGVLHTHLNAISFLAGCMRNVGSFKIIQTDIHYSYLPLPHVYER